jgi:hypothetical protein
MAGPLRQGMVAREQRIPVHLRLAYLHARPTLLIGISPHLHRSLHGLCHQVPF